MNEYKVFRIVKARSKPDALAKLDKVWYDIDVNLDFQVEKLN